MAKLMGKILIISFYYLPYSGSGVNRVLRFKRYLKKYGYDVIVVAPDRDGIPIENTIQVKMPHIVNKMCGAFTTKPVSSSKTRSKPEILWKIFKLLSIPDRQIYWIPYALKTILSILKKHKVSVVYTTSPPVSSHLVGLLLKLITKTPWIAEFRDTWLYDALEPYVDRIKLRYYIESLLESHVVNHADGIIVNSNVAEKYFKKRYTHRTSEKITTIYIGYDLSEFPNADTARTMHKMRIVHTGSLSESHYKRSIDYFLQGLQYFAQKNSDLRHHIEVLFVGNLMSFEKTNINRYNLDDIVKTIPPVKHIDALRFQRNANVLLLINHPSEKPTANIPGKLFEYIGMNKPIFAVTTEGAVKDLLLEYNAFLANPHNPIEISQKIYDIYRLYNANKLSRYTNNAIREQLTSEHSVKKLIRFINRVLKSTQTV